MALSPFFSLFSIRRFFSLWPKKPCLSPLKFLSGRDQRGSLLPPRTRTHTILVREFIGKASPALGVPYHCLSRCRHLFFFCFSFLASNGLHCPGELDSNAEKMRASWWWLGTAEKERQTIMSFLYDPERWITRLVDR